MIKQVVLVFCYHWIEHCSIYESTEEMNYFQFFERKGALLYVPSSVYALTETEHPGRLKVRDVLLTAFRTRGRTPWATFGYPLKAKGVTTSVTPFAYLTVLRTPR